MKSKPSYKELEDEIINLSRDIKHLDKALYNLMGVRLGKRAVCLYCKKSIVEFNTFSIEVAVKTVYNHAITCLENPLVQEVKRLQELLKSK